MPLATLTAQAIRFRLIGNKELSGQFWGSRRETTMNHEVKDAPKRRKVIPMGKVPAWNENWQAIEDVRIAVQRTQRQAKENAFRALAVHNYVSFAAWARVWTHTNSILEFGEKSPFTPLSRKAANLLEQLREKGEQ